MSEDTMMGSNEAYGRVKKMMGQSNTGGIQYPSGTNSRGNGGREHHAEGDMVGRENHASGDRVGGQKKNSRLGDVSAPPGHAGSMMKPHFGAPQGGREMGTRRQAIAQAHGENHKEGDMVGRESHGFGQRVGRMADRMAGKTKRGFQNAGNAIKRTANQSGNAIQSAAKQSGNAISGAAKQSGNAIQGAAVQSGNAIQRSANQTGNAMQKAMTPRPMYRRGGRAENYCED